MKIVPATANLAEQAARLIFSSGPTSLQAMLALEGKSPLDFLTHAFTKNDGQFSYTNHQVVVDGDKLLAIGSCWENPIPQEARRANLSVIVDFYSYACLPQLAYRSERISHIIPPPSEDCLGIGHIAVDESARRQGLAVALVNHFAEEARSRGKKAIELDVALCNEAAVALYLKLGFVGQETRKPAPQDNELGIIAHMHMRKEI